MIVCESKIRKKQKCERGGKEASEVHLEERDVGACSR